MTILIIDWVKRESVMIFLSDTLCSPLFSCTLLPSGIQRFMNAKSLRQVFCCLTGLDNDQRFMMMLVNTAIFSLVIG